VHLPNPCQQAALGLPSTWATASAAASKKAFGNLVSVAFYNLMFAFYLNDECLGSTQQHRPKTKKEIKYIATTRGSSTSGLSSSPKLLSREVVKCFPSNNIQQFRSWKWIWKAKCLPKINILFSALLLYIFNQLTEFRAKLLEIGKKRTHWTGDSVDLLNLNLGISIFCPWSGVLWAILRHEIFELISLLFLFGFIPFLWWILEVNPFYKLMAMI